MDRVVEEDSDVAPALLVSVTPWRSELQLWQGEKPARLLEWTAGTVSGLDSDASVSAATDLVDLLAVDQGDRTGLVRALSRQLAGPRPGTGAWRDVVDLLQVPVPVGFVDLAADELLTGQGRLVHTTGWRDAARTPTAVQKDARRRTEEALARAPRCVARIRTFAVVVGALAAWLTASSRSWIPLAAGCLVAAARVGSGRRPGRPPGDA